MFNFFIAALVVALAPGPDNLFVLAQSATHGARAGFSVICGLCTGICVQTVLLIVGVSALIAASPIAFFVLQCCGAAYLLYLAYKSFQVRAGVVKLEERDAGGEMRAGGEGAGLSFRRLYLRGIIMNLTNPKAVLFALSFIPPAVDMSRDMSPSLQMVVLGAEFVTATFIVFGSIALLAGAVKKFMLNSPKANRNLNWFSGCVFVFLAIALFLV
ncbi:LysE family translocator [Fibrobacter sp.]|uniref:LysE family translocator n=1 Tax=Fibrobacter sp. TaxID=35828 RepID=UPI0025BA4385|nr:LysE family translocator [Fibrobacter sp.]MBR2058110.1 LysE family translocator [Fibrobacter sp.]MBR2306498.1 LysE family translocator [Fibrobacter sp.]MBR4006964.1 LysE family translocator [Fibrobacter sp.]